MRLDDLPGDGCAFCRASLEHKRIDAIYCSQRCQRSDLTRLEQEARWAARPDRKCAECGEPIEAQRRADVLYCGKPCADRASYARTLGQRRAEARKGRSCVVCSGPLPKGHYVTRMYCSKACATKALVQQRREKRRAAAKFR